MRAKILTVVVLEDLYVVTIVRIQHALTRDTCKRGEGNPLGLMVLLVPYHFADTAMRNGEELQTF